MATGNHDGVMTTQINEAHVDTFKEKAIMWYVQRKWGRTPLFASVDNVKGSKRYDSDEFDGIEIGRTRSENKLFGPLSGWDRHTPVTWRNTAMARKYDPGYPTAVATLVTVLSLPIIFILTLLFGMSLLPMIGFYGIVWGLALYTAKKNKESVDRARSLDRYRRHRNWSLAMFNAGLLDGTSNRGNRQYSAKHVQVIDDIRFRPLSDEHDLNSDIAIEHGATGYLVDIPVPSTMTPDMVRDRMGVLHNSTQVAHLEYLPPKRSVEGSISSFATFKVLSKDLGAAKTQFTVNTVQKANIEAIKVGNDSSGNAVTLNMMDQHTLIAGGTGSGKSALGHALLTQLFASGAKGYLADLKFGDGITSYAKLSTAHSYATNLAELDEVAAEIAGMVKRRFQRIDMDRTPVFLFVDEINAIGIESKDADAEVKGSILASFKVILTQGRGVNVTLINLGQHIDSKTMPTALRGQFMNRILMRTQEETAVQMILGSVPKDRQAEVARVMSGSAGPGACFVQVSGSDFISTRTSQVETNPNKNRRLPRTGPEAFPEQVIDLASSLPKVEAEFQSRLTEEFGSRLSPDVHPMVDEDTYTPANSVAGREMQQVMNEENDRRSSIGVSASQVQFNKAPAPVQEAPVPVTPPAPVTPVVREPYERPEVPKIDPSKRVSIFADQQEPKTVEWEDDGLPPVPPTDYLTDNSESTGSDEIDDILKGL